MKGMRVKKTSSQKKKNTKKRENRASSLRGLGLVILCTAFAIIFTFTDKGTMESGNQNRVYAAASQEEHENISADAEIDSDELPTGIAGVVTGVSQTNLPGTQVNRIGSSCENVMVGQRVQTVDDSVAELDVSASMESTIDNLDSKVMDMAATPTIMSDQDYDNLLRIVEAEAGTEDLKGRILVANVIINRVKSDLFPDTVTEVVWADDGGVPQFSPTYDGRIYQVTVTDTTREAVKQALEGVDYSEGALFFMSREASEAHNVTWFEEDLKRLFKYGEHEFFTFPDEEDETEEAASDEDGEKEEDSEEELVSMESEEA